MNNMTQEEAKKLLPIIQAYVEGKKIQVKLKKGTYRKLGRRN